MLSIEKADNLLIPLIQELADKAWIPTYLPILGKEQVDYMMDKFYSSNSLEQQMKNGQQFFICRKGDLAVGFASYSIENKENINLCKRRRRNHAEPR